MSESRQVLLVAGSLRSASHTTRLLVAAGELFPARFAVDRVDQIRPLPHYDADLDGDEPPEPVRAARIAVGRADAIVISTPEYNGSVPGGLKNWIDWLTRPVAAHVLVGKPIGIIGASPGSKGAASAVAWLESTLGYLGAVVAGHPVVVPRVVDEIDSSGRVDDVVVAQLRELVDAVVEAVEATSAAA